MSANDASILLAISSQKKASDKPDAWSDEYEPFRRWAGKKTPANPKKCGQYGYEGRLVIHGGR